MSIGLSLKEMSKNLVILGSTGSVGRQILSVIKDDNRFKVLGLSGFRNKKLLEKQSKKFNVPYFYLPEDRNSETRDHTTSSKLKTKKLKSLKDLVSLKKADTVINAIVGKAGLEPTISAIKSGKNVCLANKECMVIAGKTIMRLARKHGVEIIPLDSELNAIWQCLKGEDIKTVKRVYLTCSGGPFYDLERSKFKDIRIKDVLKHPTWKMGKKITVDCATLMNKGFEVIETAHFFNLREDQIKVLIHRESTVHALVEFTDGNTKAILYEPDMSAAISAALYWPKREDRKVSEISRPLLRGLSFEIPDLRKFPCLKFAYQALKLGSTYPEKLVVANDQAVEKFLKGEIKFMDIKKIVAKIF